MLVVVGGHSRNIGKTSVAEGLIRALPEARWTAVKITQHGHGICSVAGQPCECAIQCDALFAISEETSVSKTDSGRFLGAGAMRSYWLRTAVGQLRHAVPEIRGILETSENAIFESNSVLDFFRPDLYVVVLDSSVADMKESARRYLDRADAYVIVDRGSRRIASLPAAEKPRFCVFPPVYVPPDLVEFAARRLQICRSTS